MTVVSGILRACVITGEQVMIALQLTLCEHHDFFTEKILGIECISSISLTKDISHLFKTLKKSNDLFCNVIKDVFFYMYKTERRRLMLHLKLYELNKNASNTMKKEVNWGRILSEGEESEENARRMQEQEYD